MTTEKTRTMSADTRPTTRFNSGAADKLTKQEQMPVETSALKVARHVKSFVTTEHWGKTREQESQTGSQCICNSTNGSPPTRSYGLKRQNLKRTEKFLTVHLRGPAKRHRKRFRQEVSLHAQNRTIICGVFNLSIGNETI